MKKNYLIIFLFFTLISVAQGNYTVTNLSDDGSSGTLRYGIQNTAASTIDFDISLTGTLTLTSNLPSIVRNITIIGNGINSLSISGDSSYNMFQVSGGAVLTISGFTFTNNASSNGSIFRADNSYSSVVASSIRVTGNSRSYAFYTNSNSAITISNSTFVNNSGTLFGSDYGSTPDTTSDIETDYSNRITVTGSTFDANTGTIFNTERYVKIDNCVFTANTQQIGSFRGVNRYQVIKSTFTNNTGGTLFSFSSWIGQSPSWGASTLGANNTLFDGNTFTGNTGTVINPGGSVSYDNRTTISNNVFINNGTSYTGSPAVVINNTLDNFISSVTHSVTEGTLTVTMSRPVFNTNTGSGTLETNDVELLISGGNATLISSIPTSISVDGNVYTLGIALSDEISGAEMITVQPVTNSIYDGSFNVAGSSQQNNSIYLNFLDDDADGISNFSDLCPNTLPGVRVYPYNGCEDTTYPFITYLNYGSTLMYPSNFILTTNHTLYFTSYDSNWNSFINKVTPEKVLSTLYTPNDGYIYSLTKDTSDNLYFVFYDNLTNAYEIKKISSDGTTSVLPIVSQGYMENLTTDTSGNLYFIQHSASWDLRELKKIAIDGTETVLVSDNEGHFQNLITDNIGNIYFVYNNYNVDSRIIKKITADGSIIELYSTNDYIQNFKVDNLGNMYFVNYSSATNSYQLKKLISTGTVSNLYVYGSNLYPQSIAIDAMNNLYFVIYDGNTNQQQINSITPEGIIVSYGEYTGSELYNDSNGTIFFDDYLNKKIITNKIVQLTATLSNFNAITKYYFDDTFTITPPSTDSTGGFSYVSSDKNVATISGTTVTIVGVGDTVITATQASDAYYEGASISNTLTVNAVSVLTKNGEITTTNTNYINKYGVIGTGIGLDSRGELKQVKSMIKLYHFSDDSINSFDGMNWSAVPSNTPSFNGSLVSRSYLGVLNKKAYHFNPYTNEVYSFDGSTWILITTNTPDFNGSLGSRSYLGVINDKSYHFNPYTGALYSFDDSDWTLINTSTPDFNGSLGSRSYIGVINNKAYHFNSYTGELYSFDGAVWTLITTNMPDFNGSIASRSYVGIINNKAYHFNPYAGDLYSFDGSVWTLITTNTPDFNGSLGAESSFMGNIANKVYHYNPYNSTMYSFDGVIWTAITNSNPGGNLGGWLSDMGQGSFLGTITN